MITKQTASRIIVPSTFLFALLLAGCPSNDNPLGSDGCQNNGRNYQVGEPVTLSACNTCVCQKDGTLGMCTGACSQQDGGLDTGGDGTLQISISNINFGTIDPGKSATATVVVTNAAPVSTGSLVVIPGANVTVSGCTGALAAKASCTLTITATPTTIGTFNSQVSLMANPGALTPLIINVTGNGTQTHQGSFAVTPSAIDLGTLQVGVPASKQTVTVTAMMGDLTDLLVSSSGAEVSIDKDLSTCTATLVAETSCTIVVDFTATTNGAKSDAIVITAGGAIGKIVTVPITAIVDNPVQPGKFAVTPSAIDLGTLQVGVPAVRQTITVAAMTALTGLSVSTSSAEVSIVENTCTATTLPAGASCSIGVSFIATTNGAKSYTIVISAGGANGTTVTVPVTAIVENPVQPGKIVATPSALDFGTLQVGVPAVRQTITVAAMTALTGLSVSTSGAEVSIVENTCTATTFPAGASCSIGVSFTATTNGAKSYTIVISAGGANGTTVTVPVTAIVENPAPVTCSQDGKTYQVGETVINSCPTCTCTSCICQKDGTLGMCTSCVSPANLCTSTGGQVLTSQCCLSVVDYPNSCLVGACGCAPEYSHSVSTCSCPAGACFDPARGCVGRPNVCTPGADQTCNNDLAISSIHGQCQSDGSCVCNTGWTLLASGKCS